MLHAFGRSVFCSIVREGGGLTGAENYLKWLGGGYLVGAFDLQVLCAAEMICIPADRS
jgi:hypothetical protein